MVEKTQYSDTNLCVLPLNEIDEIPTCICGNNELDTFFREEARLCHNNRYLTTYQVKDVHTHEVLALFTLTNDTIILNYEDDKDDFLETIRGSFPLEYRGTLANQISFPAVNIGHLAVKKDKQGMGIGSFAIGYIIHSYLNLNVAGCQFITVDSLNNSETNKFYLKCGFYNQTDRDITRHTRRMYLPLSEYK